MKRGLEAIFEVRAAAETFKFFGQEEQYAIARMMEGAILFQVGRFEDTLRVWIPLLDGEGSENARVGGQNAFLLNNIGNCFLELGHFETAQRYLEPAREFYETTNQPIPAAQVAYSLARLRLLSGDLESATSDLLIAARAFSAMGMDHHARLVRLDLVEALTAAGDIQQARSICEGLAGEFSRAGAIICALSAVGYLQECMEKGSATPLRVRYVRRYVERSRSEPNLLFTPPPEEG
jgi:tetratricopeptide (TPR) repeat protein